MNEGQTVQINTVVAVIGDGRPNRQKRRRPEAKADTKPNQDQEAKKRAPSGPAKTSSAEGKPGIKEGPAPVAGPGLTEPETAASLMRAGSRDEDKEDTGRRDAGEDDVRSSPLVRRIAKENNIDLTRACRKGTGINGRITKSDILSYIEQGGANSKAAPRKRHDPSSRLREAPPRQAPAAIKFTGDVERVPLTAMRKAIAEHMVMSRRTSAHVTTFFEVDCTRF